ncbi:ROK family protein [Labrys wisconsinensis]|uniref:Glucokinase n=1 Tax=Labrys wisconsinensis TaxID=425677 RepID=A0ABU0JG20_9HYPH|nr:ROK family protein [Labrys wisconsinensis]MDQ0472426.1 hypothetical protein [Labrys wisconsinensis]
MTKARSRQTDQLVIHGALDLPSVKIDSYNLELRDKDGFIGDRATKGAFAEKLDELRKRLRKVGSDPLGRLSTKELGKKELDTLLTKGDADAAAAVHGAIEAFAQDLAEVIRRFLRTDGWKGTERIVAGGGFRESRIGELAIARAGTLLKTEGIAIDLVPIRHHPDEAGLIGALHLMPVWMLTGHDAMLAVDIGGSNIRAGLVAMNLGKAPDLSKAAVVKSELWRHAEEEPSRTAAVERLVAMLQRLIATAGEQKLVLAPLIGIGCPGRIEADGSISRGGQNLPGGNWESGPFNLPKALVTAIPAIAEQQTMVVMHNDAVVQGLSEVPVMQDVKRWAAVTIGTGLGNASYGNKSPS